MAINLLPWREQQAQYRTMCLTQATLILFFILTLCCFIFRTIAKEQITNQKILNNYTIKQTALINLPSHSSKRLSQYQALLKNVQLIDQVRLQQYQLYHLLILISQSIRGPFLLTSITRKKDIILKGQSNTIVDVTQFINRLSKTKLLREVELEKINTVETSNLPIQFTIQLKIKQDSVNVQ